VRLDEKLSAGQELHLRRSKDGDQWKSARARVVADIDQEPPRHFIYAIHILIPTATFGISISLLLIQPRKHSLAY
jgi:hypothetical protein